MSLKINLEKAQHLLEENNVRVLMVNSAHIPQDTDIALSDDEADNPEDLFHRIGYDATRYGWMIYCSEEQVSGARESGHEALANLLDMAQQLGYHYLMIDADGPYLDEAFEAPVFEWSPR